MTYHDTIVIGASAGGVEALTKLAKRLPRDLAAAVFVVLHFPTYAVSALPEILNRLEVLPACHPKEGDLIQPGQIYVAPPEHYLTIEGDRIHLNRTSPEEGQRHTIDWLFSSAAYTRGQRVVGIILSGSLNDGTVGLATIKTKGGIAIVQDPEEARFDGMPRSAIESVSVDYILKADEIAKILNELVNESGDKVVG